MLKEDEHPLPQSHHTTSAARLLPYSDTPRHARPATPVTHTNGSDAGAGGSAHRSSRTATPAAAPACGPAAQTQQGKPLKPSATAPRPPSARPIPSRPVRHNYWNRKDERSHTSAARQSAARIRVGNSSERRAVHETHNTQCPHAVSPSTLGDDARKRAPCRLLLPREGARATTSLIIPAIVLYPRHTHLASHEHARALRGMAARLWPTAIQYRQARHPQVYFSRVAFSFPQPQPQSKMLMPLPPPLHSCHGHCQPIRSIALPFVDCVTCGDINMKHWAKLPKRASGHFSSKANRRYQ